MKNGERKRMEQHLARRLKGVWSKWRKRKLSSIWLMHFTMNAKRMELSSLRARQIYSERVLGPKIFQTKKISKLKWWSNIRRKNLSATSLLKSTKLRMRISLKAELLRTVQCMVQKTKTNLKNISLKQRAKERRAKKPHLNLTRNSMLSLTSAKKKNNQGIEPQKMRSQWLPQKA